MALSRSRAVDNDGGIPFLTTIKVLRKPSSEEYDNQCSLRCIVMEMGHTCPGTDFCGIAIENQNELHGSLSEESAIAAFLENGYISVKPL